ncbi:MAG TPA: MBL fold metallo-hydrolase [Kofleriaceae bacterium]|nr:MBL fold metallo-hydrolase [Kofleriaceae bacterium]
MADASITWIGHASALIEMGGQGVLVDPLGRRRTRALEGRYQAVLVTHAHVDHLNRWTLKRLDRSAHLLVPRGASRLVADLGFARVTEVEPGDQLAVGGLDIVGVPTIHDPGRWRKGDRYGCTGYLVARGGITVHHAGDVDMSTYDVFEDIGRRYPIDATLLPIGGLLPVWYYRMRRLALDRGVHIDPDTALHIAERLGARHLVPVHWGTVNLRLGPPGAPRRRLLEVANGRGAELVRVLRHGESLPLPTRPSGSESPR